MVSRAVGLRGMDAGWNEPALQGKDGGLRPFPWAGAGLPPPPEKCGLWGCASLPQRPRGGASPWGPSKCLHQDPQPGGLLQWVLASCPSAKQLSGLPYTPLPPRPTECLYPGEKTIFQVDSGQPTPAHPSPPSDSPAPRAHTRAAGAARPHPQAGLVCALTPPSPPWTAGPSARLCSLVGGSLHLTNVA